MRRPEIAWWMPAVVICDSIYMPSHMLVSLWMRKYYEDDFITMKLNRASTDDVIKLLRQRIEYAFPIYVFASTRDGVIAIDTLLSHAFRDNADLYNMYAWHLRHLHRHFLSDVIHFMTQNMRDKAIIYHITPSTIAVELKIKTRREQTWYYAFDKYCRQLFKDHHVMKVRAWAGSSAGAYQIEREILTHDHYIDVVDVIMGIPRPSPYPRYVYVESMWIPSHIMIQLLEQKEVRVAMAVDIERERFIKAMYLLRPMRQPQPKRRWDVVYRMNAINAHGYTIRVPSTSLAHMLCYVQNRHVYIVHDGLDLMIEAVPIY